MASILLVETAGTLKTLKTKDISKETLYKKCGFRTAEDFACRHSWPYSKTQQISVWAKNAGKANFENKYDFPPPIDKDLFFGTCAIVLTNNNSEGSSFADLTKEVWLKFYEKLFGGFEDLGDEDEYSEDELENVDPSLLTSGGYLKDGFVVSDTSLASSPEPIAAVEPEPVKKGKKKVIVEEPEEEEDDDDSDYTTSELEEEAYVFSDEE